jgi:hypothetical protein
MWIKHDMRSRTDGKMRWFIKRAGLEGYGAFWATIEVLHYQNNNELPLSGPEFEGIADDLTLDSKHYLEILELGVEAGLFSRNESHLWQPKLKRDEASRSLLREASKASLSAGGRLGGIVSGLKRRGANPEEIQSVIKAYRSQASSLEAYPSLEPRGEENRIDKKEERRGEGLGAVGCGDVPPPTANHHQQVSDPKKEVRPGIWLSVGDRWELVKEFGLESFNFYLDRCAEWLERKGESRENSFAFLKKWISKDCQEQAGFYKQEKNMGANNEF